METKNFVNDKDSSSEHILTDSQREYIVKLREYVRIDEGNVQEWMDKQLISTNQRLGIKRYSEEPYPDAPDIPLPETDKLIKKRLPGKVMSAWSPKKLATVRLEDGIEMTDELKMKVKKAEKLLNAKLRSKDVGLFKKLMLASDNDEQYGHCIFRVLNDFNIRYDREIINLDKDFQEEDLVVFDSMSKDEKMLAIADRFELDVDEDRDILDNILKQYGEGKRKIEFMRPVVKTFANINIELPTKIVVPSYTTDMDCAYRVRREEMRNRVELEQMMDSGAFIKKDLDSLTFSVASDDDTNEEQKALNEGVSDNEPSTELYKIEVINTWFKPSEPDPWQRWIFVFLKDVSDPEEALLQSIPFPFKFSGWDYVKHDNEIKDPRYYDSRGVPEQVRAYQEFMERSMNNILIRDEINNIPMFEVLDTSEIMDSHVRLRPGAKLPVQQIGTEINPLSVTSKIDVQSERIINLLKAFTEEYMGSNDQLFRSATNSGGGKTLGEIQAGVSLNANMTQLNIMSWHESLSEVYQKFFEVLKDRMVEPEVIDGETITPEDIDIDVVVSSNGSMELTEQEMASRKAMQRILMVERFMQQGIANIEDYFNAANDWLERDGVRDASQYVTSPQEILNSKLAQMQKQAQALGSALERGQEELDKLQKSIARNSVKMKKDLNQFEGKIAGKLEVGKDKTVSITHKEEING